MKAWKIEVRTNDHRVLARGYASFAGPATVGEVIAANPELETVLRSQDPPHTYVSRELVEMTVAEATLRFGEKEPGDKEGGPQFWAALEAAGFVPLREEDKTSLTAPKEQYTRPDPKGMGTVWPEGWCELLDGRTAFHSFYGRTLVTAS